MYSCWSTFGDPHREALATRESLEWGLGEEDESVFEVGDGGVLSERIIGSATRKRKVNVGAWDDDDGTWEEDEEEGTDHDHEDYLLLSLDDEMERVEDILDEPLPSAYLPGFWPSIFLVLVCLLHSLFYLMCFWNINFRVKMQYSSTSVVNIGTVVKVIPLKHKGIAEVCHMSCLLIYISRRTIFVYRS